MRRFFCVLMLGAVALVGTAAASAKSAGSPDFSLIAGPVGSTQIPHNGTTTITFYVFNVASHNSGPFSALITASDSDGAWAAKKVIGAKAMTFETNTVIEVPKGLPAHGKMSFKAIFPTRGETSGNNFTISLNMIGGKGTDRPNGWSSYHTP